MKFFTVKMKWVSIKSLSETLNLLIPNKVHLKEVKMILNIKPNLIRYSFLTKSSPISKCKLSFSWRRGYFYFLCIFLGTFTQECVNHLQICEFWKIKVVWFYKQNFWWKNLSLLFLKKYYLEFRT